MSILPQTKFTSATALRVSVVALLFLLGLGMARGLRSSTGEGKKTKAPASETRDLRQWAAEKAALSESGSAPGSEVSFNRIVGSRNLSFGMRLIELFRLVRSTPTEDLEDLLKMADSQLTGEYLNRIFSTAVMGRLREEDPDTWLEIGIMRPPFSLQNESLSFVDAALLKYSPEDLLAQMKDVKSKSWRDGLMRSLFQRMTKDFDQSMALFESLDSDDRAGAEEYFLAAAAEADSVRTLGRVRDLPDSEVRDGLLDSIFVNGGRKNPEASLEQIEIFASRKDRDRALKVLAGSWCETDKASALAYSEKITSPQMRSVFLLGLQSEWVNWPEQERREFIDRLPFRRDRENWKGVLERDEK
jgi:hypothetical protein